MMPTLGLATPLLRYGPDSAVYQLFSGAELDSRAQALLDELHLDDNGQVHPEKEAPQDGTKDATKSPLDPPDACVIRRAGRTYPFKFRMMLHIGAAPRAAKGRARNTTRYHDDSKQKHYAWEELPVLRGLRDSVASFFGLTPQHLAGANLYAYNGPSSCLKPHQDGVPLGLEGPIVYSLSLSQGGPWNYVWQAGKEHATFELPSGAVNVLGQGSNEQGTHAVPASSTRADRAWRISINFRPSAAPEAPASKRQRLRDRGLHIRAWGLYLAAEDAAIPEEVMRAAADLLSKPEEGATWGPAWQVMSRRDGVPTQVRLICGGRRTEHIQAPPEAVSLLQAASSALRLAGATEAADLTALCDNHTLNVYLPGAQLGMHKDPSEYAPFIVCICLGGQRSVTFVHPVQGRQTVILKHGDIYVLHKEGYTEWSHGMRGKASVEASSITGRLRLTKERSRQ